MSFSIALKFKPSFLQSVAALIIATELAYVTSLASACVTTLTNGKVYSRATNPIPLSIIINRGRLQHLCYITHPDSKVLVKEVLTLASCLAPEGWHGSLGHPRFAWVSQVVVVHPLADLLTSAHDHQVITLVT